MDLPKQILKESDRFLSYDREEKTFRGMSGFDLFPWVTSVCIGLCFHSCCEFPKLFSISNQTETHYSWHECE